MIHVSQLDEINVEIPDLRSFARNSLNCKGLTFNKPHKVCKEETWMIRIHEALTVAS